MQKIDMIEPRTVGSRVWRDLGQLAAEAAVIGLLFSLLLVAGVMMISREPRSQRNIEPSTSDTVTHVGQTVATST